MTNKCQAERDQECSLSLIHARQQAALDFIGQAAVVTRQIFNRWPEAIKYIRQLDEIHAKTLNAVDDAQQRTQGEIEANRQRHS